MEDRNKKIDKISDMYESIKDALHLVSGMPLSMTERKKHLEAYEQLAALRDMAIPPSEKMNLENLKFTIHEADKCINLALLEINKANTEGREADYTTLQHQVNLALNSLLHGLFRTNPYDKSHWGNLEFIKEMKVDELKTHKN